VQNEMNWTETSLDNFLRREEGEAPSLLRSFSRSIANAYFNVLGEEGSGRFETMGEVPIIRDGQTAP
jgi:hypothetical protein